jgi:hypothetical protein
VTVKYTTYGHKKVSVSGTVTFDDGSTLADAADADVTAVLVEIRDVNDNLLPPAASVPAGGRNPLKGVVKPDDVAATAQHSWTISGVVVKDYAFQEPVGNGYRKGKVTPLDVPLNNQSVNFCWASGGGETVSYTATIDGVAIKKQVAFNVIKPTAEIKVEHTGDVSADPNYFAGSGYLHYGVQKHPHPDLEAGIGSDAGIYLTVTDEIPAGGWPGAFAFLQLAALKYRQQMPDGRWKKIERAGMDGSLWLTSSFPDSPGAPSKVDGVEGIAVSAVFAASMYRLYQPQDWPFGSISVPLSKLTWWWLGSAERANGNVNNPLSLIAGEHGEGASTPTNVHPEWDSWIQEDSTYVLEN